MDFPHNISIEPGIKVRVRDKIYEVTSPITLPYSDNQGREAGLYFLTPTGETIRQAPNLEYGDIRTQALKLVDILAARYHDLVSRVEKLGKDEKPIFRILSYLFTPAEAA